ncbi:glycosyltransferase [Fusobacterium perfoetens]|uniref:glycosyltransferase n=1 Tax=Fusobacterium perfoetens TaxID=852 RepID=UPI0026EA76EC|nr:glycosyltransferase [Fusobacterium perfoetens]
MNKGVKISLIIPAYKKIDFLEAVLESINYQTYRNFEVIVAEDDNTLEEFIQTIRKKLNYTLFHIQQKDEGYQRNKALNNGVKISSGELIVVVDQDCMLHPKFLEAYATNYEKADLFTGRRVNLGKKFTEKVLEKRQRKISLLSLLVSNSSLKKFPDAIYLPWLNLKRNTRVLGSNFGIRRELLLKINGFDEDYIGYGLEDVDLDKRCYFVGARRISMKNKAIQYHLYHPEPQGNTGRYEVNRKIFDEMYKNKRHTCRNGLYKEEKLER